MTRSNRIKCIAKIAESRENDAARVLGSSQRHMAEYQARLLQLQDFQGEYSNILKEQGANGIAVSQLLEFQNFLAVLNQTICLQGKQLENSRRYVECKRKLWLASKTRLEVLNKVIKRFHIQELYKQNKKEQKECDDIAQAVSTTRKASQW